MLTSPLLLALLSLAAGSPPRTPAAAHSDQPAPSPTVGPAETPEPETRTLRSGDTAPSFTLRDHRGEERHLGEFLGRSHVLIVFYARDFAPLSTQQLRHFKERTAELADRGVTVLGISDNSWFSHKRFHRWLELNFPLLSDPHGKVAARYEARTLTSNATGSSVYLLDRRGILRYVDRDFRPNLALEFDELLAAVQEANGETLAPEDEAALRAKRDLRSNPYQDGGVE